MATDYPGHLSRNWDAPLKDYIDAAAAAALGWKIATGPAYGADPTGVLDATAALQACANDAAAAGQAFYAEGTFKISGTITITGDANLQRATFNYAPPGVGGTAIRVGNPASQLFRAQITLPKVINTVKTANGWGQIGVIGSVGVAVTNCYSCSIVLPWVNNFETGVLVTGIPVAGVIQGTQQCSFYPLHVDNNKVNWAVRPYVGTNQSDSGWANQNWLFGGRMSHNSNEGIQVPGVKHYDIADCPNVVNGWAAFGTSLESPDVVDYHIDTFGQDCYWIGCRFENTGGDTHRRVRTRGVAKGNIIRDGFNAGQITASVEGTTAMPFDFDTSGQVVRRTGTAAKSTLQLENPNSSTAPVLTIMEAGAGLISADPTTAWAVRATAQQWAGKRSADPFARLTMDFLNGRAYVGDGTVAPVGYLGGSASTIFVGGGLPFVPLSNSTQDLGITSLKWRYVRAGTAVQTGAVATTSRPAATTAGAGAMVYDTTLNKPVWSDGTNWRDATGTIV